MRQILIAVFAYCILNLFIPKWWEALMSSAPRIVIDAITFAAAVICIGFVISADPVWSRLKNPASNPISSTLLVAGLVAAIAVAAWWIFIVPDQKTDLLNPKDDEPGTSEANKSDFTASVIRYRYSSETHELISDVHFVNNGTTRRTVLGVTFTYRLDDETRLVVNSLEELHGGQPVYVEPNQPILVTYRHKLGDETLTTKIGVVFGLQVATIRLDGGMNETSIEAMAVTGFPADPKIRGLLTIGQTRMSLDVTGGRFPMETPEVPTSPSPSTNPIATPSPTAKSGLERVKILDTPDGAILAVEEPDTTPTPTPQLKPPTNLTPRELFALVEGHTPLQVVKLIAPYKGLWTEVEGETTGHVWPQGDDCAATISLNPEGKVQHVECRFEHRWCDELDRLKAKTVIKVRGKITTHNGETLVLSECELVSPSPAPTSPRTLVDADEVFALFKGRTALNVVDLIEPYKGKSIALTGKLGHLSASGNVFRAVLFRQPGDVGFSCKFDTQWGTKLRALKTGDIIKVLCKIDNHQSGGSLALSQCALQ